MSSFAELKEKRLELGISLSQVANYLGASAQHLRHLEISDAKKSKWLSPYENYISGCIEGKINFTPTIWKKRTPQDLCATEDEVKTEKLIRETLRISVSVAANVIGKCVHAFSNKERGNITMTKNEYSALIAFYQGEYSKLRKTLDEFFEFEDKARILSA